MLYGEESRNAGEDSDLDLGWVLFETRESVTGFDENDEEMVSRRYKLCRIYSNESSMGFNMGLYITTLGHLPF